MRLLDLHDYMPSTVAVDVVLPALLDTTLSLSVANDHCLHHLHKDNIICKTGFLRTVGGKNSCFDQNYNGSEMLSMQSISLDTISSFTTFLLQVVFCFFAPRVCSVFLYCDSCMVTFIKYIFIVLHL